MPTFRVTLPDGTARTTTADHVAFAVAVAPLAPDEAVRVLTRHAARLEAAAVVLRHAAARAETLTTPATSARGADGRGVRTELLGAYLPDPASAEGPVPDPGAHGLVPGDAVAGSVLAAVPGTGAAARTALLASAGELADAYDACARDVRAHVADVPALAAAPGRWEVVEWVARGPWDGARAADVRFPGRRRHVLPVEAVVADVVGADGAPGGVGEDASLAAAAASARALAPLARSRG